MAARKGAPRKRQRRKSTPPRLNGTAGLRDVKDLFEIADFVELRAMVTADLEYSQSDLLDDLRVAKNLGVDLLRPPSLGDDDDDDDREDEDDASDHEDADSDAMAALADDVFSHLHYREHEMARGYPFRLDANATTLRVRDCSGPSGMFYALLLLTSMLGRADKSSQQLLTRNFEVLCADLLRNQLSWRGTVSVFGTSSGAVTDNQFSGSLWKKLNTLAHLTGEKVLVDRNEFSKKNNGDGGLDILAHLAFQDAQPGHVLMFGQCACTDGWDTKQHSATYETWSAMMTLSQPLIPLTFVPFFFRNNVGDWPRKRSIHRTVLLDRLRLVRAFALAEVSLPDSLAGRLAQLLPCCAGTG